MIAHSNPVLRRGLEAALSAVPAEVRRALDLSHKILSERGVPHVLIGGLAVGAHGYSYATQDVDYLVHVPGSPASPLESSGLIATFRPGIPVDVGGVRIDYLTPDDTFPPHARAAMQAALEEAASRDDVAVIPTGLLVYMKLKAGRMKDRAAVVELLKAGMDQGPVWEFIEAASTPGIWRAFDGCCAAAAKEES